MLSLSKHDITNSKAFDKPACPVGSLRLTFLCQVIAHKGRVPNKLYPLARAIILLSLSLTSFDADLQRPAVP